MLDYDPNIWSPLNNKRYLQYEIEDYNRSDEEIFNRKMNESNSHFMNSFRDISKSLSEFFTAYREEYKYFAPKRCGVSFYDFLDLESYMQSIIGSMLEKIITSNGNISILIDEFKKHLFSFLEKEEELLIAYSKFKNQINLDSKTSVNKIINILDSFEKKFSSLKIKNPYSREFLLNKEKNSSNKIWKDNYDNFCEKIYEYISNCYYEYRSIHYQMEELIPIFESLKEMLKNRFEYLLAYTDASDLSSCLDDVKDIITYFKNIIVNIFNTSTLKYISKDKSILMDPYIKLENNCMIAIIEFNR